MATTPGSPPTAVRGISTTLNGYIIADISDKSTDINEETPDQMGAIVDEQTYDTRIDVRATLWGPDTPPTTAGATFTIGSHSLKIDSVEKVGTYNQKQKWVVSGHRFDNFPGA